jgi:hypothetical protein
MAGVTLPLASLEDVALVRSVAGDLAALLQLAPEQQISLATAVWQVARCAAGLRGELESAVVDAPPSAAVRVTVSGVPAARLGAAPADRLDLDALRRLVDRLESSEVDEYATLRLSAQADPDAWVPDPDELEWALRRMTRRP